MKTFIASGSHRQNGNTVAIVNELKKHLHGEVYKLNTINTKISPCTACDYCQIYGECAIEDEMQEIYDFILEADNIVIASPVYFGDLSGSLLHWASRLQYLSWLKHSKKSLALCPEQREALCSKQRKGVIILVNGKEGYKGAAISTGKVLLNIMGAEDHEILYWPDADAENKPNLSNPNMEKLIKLANSLNTR